MNVFSVIAKFVNVPAVAEKKRPGTVSFTRLPVYTRLESSSPITPRAKAWVPAFQTILLLTTTSEHESQAKAESVELLKKLPLTTIPLPP